MRDQLLRERICSWMRSILKTKNLLLGEQILSPKNRPILDVIHRMKQMGGDKNCVISGKQILSLKNRPHTGCDSSNKANAR